MRMRSMKVTIRSLSSTLNIFCDYAHLSAEMRNFASRSAGNGRFANWDWSLSELTQSATR
jgi:hypothetical protein